MGLHRKNVCARFLPKNCLGGQKGLRAGQVPRLRRVN